MVEVFFKFSTSHGPWSNFSCEFVVVRVNCCCLCVCFVRSFVCLFVCLFVCFVFQYFFRCCCCCCRFVCVFVMFVFSYQTSTIFFKKNVPGRVWHGEARVPRMRRRGPISWRFNARKHDNMYQHVFYITQNQNNSENAEQERKIKKMNKY